VGRMEEAIKRSLDVKWRRVMRVMVPGDVILQHGSRVSSTLSKCTVHAVAIGITTKDGVITQRFSTSLETRKRWKTISIN
jgi:hypothetical protein